VHYIQIGYELLGDEINAYTNCPQRSIKTKSLAGEREHYYSSIEEYVMSSHSKLQALVSEFNETFKLPIMIILGSLLCFWILFVFNAVTHISEHPFMIPSLVLSYYAACCSVIFWLICDASNELHEKVLKRESTQLL